MLLLWSLVLVLLPWLVIGEQQHIRTRPLNTHRSAQLGNYYLCHLELGTPREPVRLAVTFAHGDIILNSQLRNPQDSSSTWHQPGFDWVVIGGDVFKWSIRLDPQAEWCGGLCSGEIGLGPSSRLWSIWNSATFYRNWIVLGGEAPQHRSTTSHQFTLPFLESTSDHHYRHPVNVTGHPVGRWSMRLTGTGRTRLPEELYDELFYLQHNITVEDIQLTINQQNAMETTHRGVKEPRVVMATSAGGGERQEIVLGSMLFEEYPAIHVDRFNNQIILYSTSDSSGRSVGIWHQLFIGIFWFLFLYWKTTNLAHLYDYDKRYNSLELVARWPMGMTNDQRVYFNFKVTYSLLLWFEIVSTAVILLVNGPPSYHPVVDYFLTILFWCAWVVMLLSALFTWVANVFFTDLSTHLMQFTCWLRASADICVTSLIVILLLNGTNINTGMGIIVVFFQLALYFTLVRTLVSFVALIVLTGDAEVTVSIGVSLVVMALGTWVTWEYFFNSLLSFISETLSINVNMISSLLVITVWSLTIYFHRLFLMANEENIRNRINGNNKVKKH